MTTQLNRGNGQVRMPYRIAHSNEIRSKRSHVLSREITRRQPNNV